MALEVVGSNPITHPIIKHAERVLFILLLTFFAPEIIMTFLKTACFPFLAHYCMEISLIFALLSLIAFVLYGMDKYKAKHGRRRISEKTLLLSAFFFGGIGAYLGMRVFHHKTKHWYFQLLLPLFMLLQLAFLALLWFMYLAA